MADEHRRVEPRGIVGSGMQTDAERIEQLELEQARVERTWRDAPKRRFGEVLREAPAWSPEEGDDDAARQRSWRGDREEQADTNADEEGASNDEGSDEKPLPRVPPDPRVARLHAMLDQRAGKGPEGSAKRADNAARPRGRGGRRP